MLDPVIAAGMVFALLVILLIGGFIVTYPVTSKLGKALESYLEQKKDEGPSEREVERLRRQLLALKRQVDGMAEKQEFVEELLQEKGRASLPEGEAGADD